MYSPNFVYRLCVPDDAGQGSPGVRPTEEPPEPPSTTTSVQTTTTTTSTTTTTPPGELHIFSASFAAGRVLVYREQCTHGPTLMPG